MKLFLKLIIFLMGVAGVAADFVELNAFSSTSCEGAPQARVTLFIDIVECINSTSWKNAPNGNDKGFLCTYPSPSFGSSSSFMCYKGDFNKTAPLQGAVLLNLPSRDTCNQQFDGFQQFTPGACLLNGPESTQALCDKNSVLFSRFHDATCAGTAYEVERYQFGCNLSSSAYFQIATCSGYPPA
jgi:hypothetical protein